MIVHMSLDRNSLSTLHHQHAPGGLSLKDLHDVGCTTYIDPHNVPRVYIRIAMMKSMPMEEDYSIDAMSATSIKANFSLGSVRTFTMLSTYGFANSTYLTWSWACQRRQKFCVDTTPPASIKNKFPHFWLRMRAAFQVHMVLPHSPQPHIAISVPQQQWSIIGIVTRSIRYCSSRGPA